VSVEDTIGVHVLWLEAKNRGTFGSLLIAIHYKRSLLQPVVWLIGCRLIGHWQQYRSLQWRHLGYTCLGLARTIYIRCTYGIFGREITKYTVIYGVYIRFWPTLHMPDDSLV